MGIIANTGNLGLVSRGDGIIPTAYDPTTEYLSGNLIFSNSNRTVKRTAPVDWVSVWSEYSVDPAVTSAYWEYNIDTRTGNLMAGLGPQAASKVPWASDDNLIWISDGRILLNSVTFPATVSTWTTGDVVGFNLVNGVLYAYKNGSIQNSGSPVATGFNFANTRILTSIFVPNDQVTINAGQDPFVGPFTQADGFGPPV